MKTIPISGDFFIGNDYWQYECQVQVNPKTRLIWDTDIIKSKGRGPDDEDVEINDTIEDIIIEKAELRMEELINDPLVPYDLGDD